MQRIKNPKSWVPSWRSIPNNFLQFTRLTGITNVTGYVENTSGALPKRVIHKEFGHGADLFINRKDEINTVNQLDGLGFTPKQYGVD